MKSGEIIKQHDLKDCGACSLLSIIKHYGGFISLEQIRIDTHTSLEGTTAYYLVEAAKRYGFDSYGLCIKSLEELKEVILPAIVHVEINHLPHFVVLYKIGKRLEIMDPAKGKVKMSYEEFEKIWSKNIILFYPKYSLPKTNANNFFKNFFEHIIKKEKLPILYILILTLIFTSLTIFTSFYFKIGINILNENNNLRLLIFISLPFFFLFFIKILIYYLKNYFKTILNKNADGWIYHYFITKLFLLPNYFIKNRTTGEIMLRLSELSNFKLFFSEMITTFCIDSILSIGIGIILFKMNTKLFLLLCVFGIVYLFYGMISGKLLYKNALKTNESEVQFQSLVVENLDSLLTLKNLNVLKKAIKKLEVRMIQFLKKNFNLNILILNTNTFSFLLEELLHFLVITIGLIEIVKKEITLIDLITFESLVGYFIEPFKNMIGLIPEYNFMKVNLEKMTDFFTMELEDSTKGLHYFKSGDILVDNLTFSYNKFNPIFEKFNLQIKENSCTLFKGKSGCGKSTLCQMISRLIDTKNSNIKIGKININDYSLKTIRKNITYVGQKECLIQETIRNNILLYRNINENKFKQVVEICGLEEIVEKKPFRYETYLLKDSINLSGGEKQRIILARALLNDSKIYILDEALSEVNEDLEIEIIKKIKKIFKNKTIIYVSHKNHEKYFDTVVNFGA